MDAHAMKAQISDELTCLRNRVAELEKAWVRQRRREGELLRSLDDLKNTLRDTVVALASTVDTKDSSRAGHQRSVARLSRAIAGKMNLPGHQVNDIYLAALVHDIGKISVPGEILAKPGPLVDTEVPLIKDHPQVGFEILEKVDFPHSVCRMVLQHHERMNGSGYPQGLTGENIITGARILAVADVVEAISSRRSYRKTIGIETALKEVRTYQGLLYDPDVVSVCLNLFLEEGFEWKC